MFDVLKFIYLDLIFQNFGFLDKCSFGSIHSAVLKICICTVDRRRTKILYFKDIAVFYIYFTINCRKILKRFKRFDFYFLKIVTVTIFTLNRKTGKSRVKTFIWKNKLISMYQDVPKYFLEELKKEVKIINYFSILLKCSLFQTHV